MTFDQGLDLAIHRVYRTRRGVRNHQLTVLNGTTYVECVPSPAENQQRMVRRMTFHNRDSINQNCQVKIDFADGQVFEFPVGRVNLATWSEPLPRSGVTDFVAATELWQMNPQWPLSFGDSVSCRMSALATTTEGAIYAAWTDLS